MSARPDVVVGVPICRRTAYVLDKFLCNQEEIQKAYPGCSLAFATDEPDFIFELEEQIKMHDLTGRVIAYETVKPAHARTRLWSITCGREALRRYALSMNVEYLLFLDGDMVFEPSVINIMKDRIRDFDVVFSGYLMPPGGFWGFGAGCLMISRIILGKIIFRCYEFKNGQIIDESETLDCGLFKCRAKVNKGIFVSIKHYINRDKYYTIEPRPVGWFQMMVNNMLIRFMITQVAILIKYNIARKLKRRLYRTVKPSV